MRPRRDRPSRGTPSGRLGARDRRTWRLLVPIHLVAFLILYFASLRLSESGYAQAAAATARVLLRQIVEEVLLRPESHTGAQDLDRLLAPVVRGHEVIELRVLDLEGNPLGGASPLPADELPRLATFLAAGSLDRFGLDSRGGLSRMWGLMRIDADKGCVPCHRAGAPVAVAAIRLDFTRDLRAVQHELRLNMALLLLLWTLAVGASTWLVRRSVDRSARRLEADLAAAEAGREVSEAAGGVVLDPVSAQLHASLHRFLRRHHERQAELASRLAHTDQLAALGQLAASLAHEIKNPLAGIQSALELVREDSSEGSSARQLCDEMLSELRRVNGTLQLLLTSARPSPPRRVPTPVEPLVEEVAQLVAPGLRKRRVTLRTEVAPAVGTARLDPAKIRQVLVNLLQNASEAVADGGHIALRASPFPQGDGILLAVEDDGPGIPDDLRERIFEPFFTTKFSGTGLGLAIARRLVEQHGGTLDLESETGKGTTFFVLLPAEASSVPAFEAPEE